MKRFQPGEQLQNGVPMHLILDCAKNEIAFADRNEHVRDAMLAFANARETWRLQMERP